MDSRIKPPELTKYTEEYFREMFNENEKKREANNKKIIEDLIKKEEDYKYLKQQQYSKEYFEEMEKAYEEKKKAEDAERLKQLASFQELATKNTHPEDLKETENVVEMPQNIVYEGIDGKIFTKGESLPIETTKEIVNKELEDIELPKAM